MSLEIIYEAVLNGDANTAGAETQKALADGIPAADILHQACVPAMTKVGELFEAGEKFVPEMLISARAMQAAMEVLKPKLVDAGVESAGKVVIGTVAGDLHDIGKNLVAMMYKGAGFEVVDLGVDVAPEKFVQASDEGAEIVGLSALLTTTMVQMKNVIESLKEKGSKAKIIVGGAPVTQNYSDEIGASGYAADAASAVEIGKALIK